MNWGSAQAFFEMGGYGLFVWGSYGVTALVIAGELVALRKRRRAALAFARRALGQGRP
ncbi:MAG: heme exporter protein CcmD [Burkholderiales bacterium]